MVEHEAPGAGATTFQWHPQYRGQTVDAVERDLATEIAKDQRAYELALSGAEASEHEALASVMELEKRWSEYSFGWAEMSPDALAHRIVAFEWERERRHEMITYEQYLDEASPMEASAPANRGWRESMSDEQRRKVANAGAVVVMLVIAIVIIIVLSMVL